MDSINSLLGPGYQVLMQGGVPVVVEKEPFEDLGAPLSLQPNPEEEREESTSQQMDLREDKTFDDRVFQFYIGCLSVVGLFALFRLLKKNQ